MGSQGGTPAAVAQSGPPYIPQMWSLGGINKVDVDVPITAVFLALFIGAAATHMTILQLNQRRGHKFLISGFLFGFCMARTVTCILRIASTCKPHNIRLAIAASIFVAAGVLIIFIVNLIFAQRIVRSMHPRWGWHFAFSKLFIILYVLVGLTLGVVITATVQTFYTLRPRTRTIDRDLQLYGSTFLAIISILPLPLFAIAFFIPRKAALEKFGAGRHRTKVLTLMTGTTLVALGAWYRCGTSWKHPVPRTQPMPDYFAKACFYIFNFTVEIITIYLYAIMRVDLRFHIPNGAHGPGSYAAGQEATTSRIKGAEVDAEKGDVRPAQESDAEHTLAGTDSETLRNEKSEQRL